MKICWNITNRCNIACKHCFRDKERQELPIDENLKILKNISGYVSEISFSGGEALMYANFIDLLKAAKKYGLRCALTTNALLLNKDNLGNILKYLNRIAFSLDYICDLDNAAFGRGDGYTKHLQSIIHSIKTLNSNISVKLNTVVSRKNMEILDGIKQFVKAQGIDVWQIMRYCPYRQSDDEVVQAYSITDAEFVRIKSKYEAAGDINIVVKNIDEIENQYVIAPNGDLIIGQDNKDVVLLANLHRQDLSHIKNSFNRNIYGKQD